MSHSRSFIGFPPPILGDRPIRLPLLHQSNGLIALPKPCGCLVVPHPWHLKTPDLEQAINQQAAAGKPELCRLGISAVNYVYPLDKEISGIALFTTDNENLEKWRNLAGSQELEFEFLLVTRDKADWDSMECDLPVVPDQNRKRLNVSHRYGKKAITRFEVVERFPPFKIVKAISLYPRYHQIRLHAFESGLKIVGETLYANEPPVYLSNIKKHYQSKKVENPLYTEICVHLGSVLSKNRQYTLEVSAPLPDQLSVLIKQIRRHCRQTSV